MERRARLTYERLVSSIGRLYDAVEVQFPERKDIRRAQDLKQVIDNALRTAHAGMSGAPVALPVQLKRDIEARIVEVHEQHNEVEERKHQANDDTQNSAFQSHALSGDYASTSISKQKTAVPTLHALDSGKENATASAAPSRLHSTQKPSAIKKTTITKRVTNSKPSTPAGIRNRPTRPARNKSSIQIPTVSPISTTDEADRRAAAAALLGLADHSPNSSSVTPTSSSNALTPSTGGGKKRTYAVYKDDVEFPSGPQNQTRSYAGSSVVPKKRMIGAGIYAPVPRLETGMGAQMAFLKGVEYVLGQMAAREGLEREEGLKGLRVWVAQELGMRDSFGLRGSEEIGRSGGCGSTVYNDADMKSISTGGKGFWDVV